MSEGVLSQEEIDALLNSDSAPQPPEQPAAAAAPPPVQAAAGGDDHELSEVEKDAVGEVANIVMGSAATALSTLLGRKVEITTPVVQLTDPEKFRQEYPLPYLLVNVEYVTGLKGSNVLIIKDGDAKVMVDLMMGGDGQAPPTELADIHLSAISEAMNQMMGSASTAMSTIIKDRVEISSPTVETINFATDELKGTLGTKGQILVKVSFRMTIEGLVDSEIMQLLPIEFAKSMVKNLMEEMTSAEPVKEEAPMDIPNIEEASMDIPNIEEAPMDIPNLQDILGEAQSVIDTPAPMAAASEVAFHEPGAHMFDSGQAPGVSPMSSAMPVGPGVPVQPVQFAPLQMSGQTKEIANIDLIMDVPLQITVELGKTRKSIRDILALGPGSVVELDKLAGEPVDLLVNGKLLAKGEVVVIDENFGIRVTDIVSPIERVANLQ